MKLQKAPGSKPKHPKKLQIPKFQIRTAFWNFEDCDFLGPWDLELFKTPLLPPFTTPFPICMPKSRRWNHSAAAFVVGIFVMLFPAIAVSADQLLTWCRARGRADNLQLRPA